MKKFMLLSMKRSMKKVNPSKKINFKNSFKFQHCEINFQLLVQQKIWNSFIISIQAKIILEENYEVSISPYKFQFQTLKLKGVSQEASNKSVLQLDIYYLKRFTSKISTFSKNFSNYFLNHQWLNFNLLHSFYYE